MVTNERTVSSMTPSVGRTVAYSLSAHDAESITARRKESGVLGNPVSEGDVFPMVIVRVWGTGDHASVNGRVLLDGDDTFWATSRQQGEGPFRWREFPRV